MLESGFYNMDCMDGMAQFPDKFFELAIVDPPYGIGMDGAKETIKNGVQIRKSYDFKKWDSAIPERNYFQELMRVSRNQIIWGGNYFTDYLPPTKAWVFWYKGQQGLTMSDGEMAWTSCKKVTRMYTLHRTHLWKENPIHPTQKPIALYRWLLANYAKPGDKILDTHVGSASSLIACHQMGFEYWGFELDTDYFNAATERLNEAKAQVSMTELMKPPQIEQIKIV
jgi:site-specific DNA-methyltransferase (adenine-specific)